MDEHQIELQPLLWCRLAGSRFVVLFWAGLRLPLQTRLGRWPNWLYAGGVVVVGFGAVRARQRGARAPRRSYRPDPREDLHAVGGGDDAWSTGSTATVRVTYFYHSQDPGGAARHATSSR